MTEQTGLPGPACAASKLLGSKTYLVFLAIAFAIQLLLAYIGPASVIGFGNLVADGLTLMIAAVLTAAAHATVGRALPGQAGGSLVASVGIGAATLVVGLAATLALDVALAGVPESLGSLLRALVITGLVAAVAGWVALVECHQEGGRSRVASLVLGGFLATVLVGGLVQVSEKVASSRQDALLGELRSVTAEVDQLHSAAEDLDFLLEAQAPGSVVDAESRAKIEALLPQLAGLDRLETRLVESGSMDWRGDDDARLGVHFEMALRRLSSVATNLDAYLASGMPDAASIRSELASVRKHLASGVAGLGQQLVARTAELKAWYRIWSWLGPLSLAVAGLSMLVPVARVVGRHERMLEQRTAAFKRQDLVLRHARNLVILCDENGLVTWVNPAFESATGYTLAEMAGRKPGSVLQCPETDPQTVARVARALSRQEPIRTPILNAAKNGRRYWIDMDIHPERDASGRVIGFIAIESDISETVDLQRYLASLFKAGAAGTVIQDASGAVVDANPEAERLLGLTLEQMRGRVSADPRWRAIDEDGESLPGNRHPAMITLATGVPQDNAIMGIETPDGERRWLKVNARRETDARTGEPFVISSFFDVTEDRMRESQIAEARASAEQAFAELFAYKTALDQHSIVAVTDRRGRITYANERFCEISGYSRDELLGKTHAIVNSGHHPPEFFAQMWATIATGATWAGEICNRAKDGSHYWVDTTIVPMRGTDGRIHRYVAIRYDVSARVRAAARLGESEAKFRTLYELAPTAIALTRFGDGRFLDGNQALFNITGYSRDELLQLTYHDVTAPGYDEHDEGHDEALHLRGHMGPFEKKYIRKDGAEIWVIISGVLIIGDDGEEYVWTLIQDITARRLQEQLTEANERRLQTVIEGTRAGVWEWHLPSGALVINERWCEQIGVDPAVVGDDGFALWQSRVHPEDLERLDAAMRRHAAGEDPHFEEEYRIRHGDGSWVWLLTRGRISERDADTGRAIRMVGTNQDISVRKAAELALLESSSQIQAVIDNFPGGIVCLDDDLRVLFCNREYRRLLDLPDTLLDKPGVSLADIFHFNALRGEFGPGDPEEQVAELLATARVREFIVKERQRPDGRTIEIRSQPVPTGGFVISYVDVTERKHTVDSLHTLNHQLKAVIDNFPGGITFVDGRLRMVSCNDRYIDLLDLPSDLFANGMPSLDDIFRFNIARGEYGPGDPEEIYERLMSRARIPEPHIFERTRPNGVTLEIRGIPVPGGGFVTTYMDVTERRAAQDLIIAKSRLAEQKSSDLEITLAHMNQGLSVFDKEGRLTIWNRRYLELFNLSEDEVSLGSELSHILKRQKERGDFTGDVDTYVADIRRHIAEGRTYPALNRTTTGVVISTVHSPAPDGGWVSTHEDVTERERSAAQFAYAAEHDLLTGLINRNGLRERVTAALAAIPDGGPVFSVLLVDLDRFKSVNDTFGHATGDRLLQAVAVRMRSTLRDGDLVARLGGDEFAVLQFSVKAPREEASRLAARLLSTMTAPYSIDGRQLYIGASIGVATAPQHGDSVDELLRNADYALYDVKATGRNTFRIFDERLEKAARDYRELQADLREALGRDEFHLVYQPIVEATSHRVIGMEALLRWTHPRRGAVRPDVFIPIAEKTGLIGPIGRFVVATALRDAATWPSHVRLAVNVSPAQLAQHDFVDIIARELLATRVEPSRLEIEVTETVLLGNDNGLLSQLHQIHSLGVRIALDDFGTGYSSLSYLREFPFDKIKIDRSFVCDIDANPQSAAIVCAVASLAKSLDMETTAEGVETEEQGVLLTTAGCGSLQGYLYGRPKPANQLAFGDVIGTRAGGGAR